MLTARTRDAAPPWLPAVLESRTSLSPPLIAYFEGLLATLLAGGFSYDLAHHALHAMGSRAIGFSQELFDPAKGGGDGPTCPRPRWRRWPRHSPTWGR